MAILQQEMLLKTGMMGNEVPRVEGLNELLLLDEKEASESQEAGHGERNTSSSSDAVDAADLFDQYINKDMLMESIEEDSSPGLLRFDSVSPLMKMEGDSGDKSGEMSVSGGGGVEDMGGLDMDVSLHDDLTHENVESWAMENNENHAEQAGPAQAAVPAQAAAQTCVSAQAPAQAQAPSVGNTIVNSSTISNLVYYQQSESLLTNILEFGRTQPFKTVYLNPQEFLPKEDDAQALPYKIHVDGVPPMSRVETQIKINIAISPAPRQYMIHLPTDSITRQKFYLTHDITEYPANVREQMLYLETFLLCSSTNKSTYVCSRCIRREQRRAARRKSGISDNLLWCNNENKRAIVFNSKQVILMKENENEENTKSFSLMTRIVCYCRHHKEPEGFKILVVLRDASNNILARTVTNNIVIMDKKTSSSSSGKGKFTSSDNRASDGSSTYVKDEYSTTGGVASDYSNADLFSMVKADEPSATVRLSVPKNMPSPTSITEDSSENVQTDHGPMNSSATGFLHSSAAASARTNGYKRPRNSMDAKSERSFSNSSTSTPAVTNSASLSAGASSTLLLHNVQHHQQQQQQPSQLQASNQHALPMIQRPHMLAQQLGASTIEGMNSSSSNNNSNVPQKPRPFIQRVIPAQGPIKGGIEVTLLGSNFKPNMVVKFGENRALSTQCWSDSTIVTYLPPTSKPGQVLVSVFEREDANNEHLLSNMSNSRAIFTYVDDTDRQLIELALQIVGLKMNGKLEDARNIAKKIVGSDGGSSNGSTPGSNISPSGNYGGASYSDSPGNFGYNDNNNNSAGQVYYSDEMLIIKVVKLLNPSSNLSMCNSDGQTMLHLACLKGYFHLVSALVNKGARVDVTDSFGFTPLHFACINGDVKAIQLLVGCKANVSAIADNGVNALDLYRSQHVSDSDRNTNNTYTEDILRLLSDQTDAGDGNDDNDDDDFKAFGRKMSTSSFHSSVYCAESVDSVDYGYQVHVSKMVQDTLSDDSEYESSGYDDDSSISGYDDSTEGLLLSERDTVAALEVSSGDENEPLAVAVAVASATTGDAATAATNNNNNNTTAATAAEPASPEGLPKYEDLFPVSASNTDKSKTIDASTALVSAAAAVAAASATDPDAADSHDSQTSETSEDEEEALQVRLNRFFQQRQNFRNDKMLLFFWIPIMVILSSAFLAFHFGKDGNKIRHISEAVSETIRTWMAKTLLGNDRMKAVFRESIHNLQNHRILGENNYAI